jgi:4-hydroxy-4-methyl-2-oxoglutarate aldolase
MTKKELITELRKYRCADLSDAMDALGLVDTGTMSEAKRPLRPGIEFKGFAHTVKLLPKRDSVVVCADVDQWRDELAKGCENIYQFVDTVTAQNAEDMVICIDMSGVRGGVWGSEIALTMMERGIEGAIIDGGCRDSFEANVELAPVFCTRRTFTHAYGRVEWGGVGGQVVCGGVTINEGDIICADDDGVLVIPSEVAPRLIQFAHNQLSEDIKVRTEHYKNLNMEEDETLRRLKGEKR